MYATVSTRYQIDMSGQTYAGPNDPLYLSTRGVNSISFTKQSSPPAAYLNKGIMYELDDGLLYYNGAAIQTGGSTVADALATSGADVDVAAAAPPSAGQVLKATSATTATWSAPGAALIDNQTFVVDAADATKRLGFNIGGTTGVTATLVSNATAARNITLPDATTSLVGCVDTVATNEIVQFSSATNLIGTGVIMEHTQADDWLYISNQACPAGTKATSVVIGSDHFFDGNITVVGDSVVIGDEIASAVSVVSSSVLIGSKICYQGAVNKTINNTVAIGTGYGQQGMLDTASENIAIGNGIGLFISTGDRNVIAGHNAGNAITTGSDNVMAGVTAGLVLTTGSDNVFVGKGCGDTITTGSNNVYIGADVTGAAVGESNFIRIGSGLHTDCYIAGIRGVTTDVADAIPVLIDSAGQLGTVSSSIKYKENVEDLVGSEALYQLRPVQFNYKKQPHHKSIGLIAEEVESVDASLCIYQPVKTKVLEERVKLREVQPDAELEAGDNIEPEPEIEYVEVEKVERELLTVDYARVNVMLLAELQRLKKKVDSLEGRIDSFRVVSVNSI